PNWWCGRRRARRQALSLGQYRSISIGQIAIRCRNNRHWPLSIASLAMETQALMTLTSMRETETTRPADQCAGESTAIATPPAGGPSLVCVGGEDHHLRIPFLVALRERGINVKAIGSGKSAAFSDAAIPYSGYELARFVDPAADRRTVRHLRSLLSRDPPDLVQSFDTKPNLLAPLAAAGLPGVRTVRTINGMGWVYSARNPAALALRPVQRMLHRRAARHVAATVFQNADDLALFTRHGMLGSGTYCLVRGSGIDVTDFEAKLALTAPAASLRAEFGLGDAPVVMTVTRLTRQKGVGTLLAAAARVHAVRPDVRFVLVGAWETEGWMAIRPAEIERHRPYVLATGSRPDVPALLNAANIFAFPTEYREGVPRVLLEAGMAELPIVTTDMPGCNDVVRNGWSGVIVPPRNPRGLAAAILGLLDDPAGARVLGARASARVRYEFGLELIVNRYCDLYRSLLGRTAARLAGAAPGI
ncbi:MAG: glycosyltransferase, partial [Acetobacteraceae bacterium]